MDFHAARDPRFARSADGHTRYAEFVSGQIGNAAACVLIAEQNQTIVGYCLALMAKHPPVYRVREYGSILDLAVTANFRRQGIGEALVNTTLQWFAAHNLYRVEVRVATINEISNPFWQMMGFIPYVATLSKEIV